MYNVHCTSYTIYTVSYLGFEPLLKCTRILIITSVVLVVVVVMVFHGPRLHGPRDSRSDVTSLPSRSALDPVSA